MSIHTFNLLKVNESVDKVAPSKKIEAPPSRNFVSFVILTLKLGSIVELFCSKFVHEVTMEFRSAHFVGIDT